MPLFHRHGFAAIARGFAALAGRPLAALARALRKLTDDRRGASAVFVALAIVPLVAFLGLAVDTTRGYLVKSRLNQALDAAALAGGRVYASANRDDDIRMYFTANFPDGYLGSVITPVTITPDDVSKTLAVAAQATIPTTFMRLLNIDSLDVASSAQVTIEAQNVEVAMVLDITGSMDASDSMDDLRAAANDLVDIVVQDQQDPFYTKVAIVPFSMGVNVGPTYVTQVRGAIAPHAITDITEANPAVVTSANHGFSTGDKVFIAGVGGLTEANNVETAGVTASRPQFWVVEKIDDDKFSLKKCSTSSCSSTSDVSSTGWSGTYTPDSGTIACTTVGCPYMAFRRDSDNSWRTWLLSTTDCVTERTGAEAYTDAAPSTAVVSPRYEPAGGVTDGNSCISNPVIQPLSSNKSTLHTMIDGLTAAGSTAGQIGTAWGWYMLSPSFAYLWPADSQPAAYGTPKLLKVAIIMTDGDFNTIYANGIIAQNAGSGSGSSSNKINQNATNGDGFTQAKTLCAAMKAPAPGPNIEIYTVGLGLSGSAAAVDFLNSCATSASHVYLPETGTDLQDAFHDIAQKISKLRLSK